jgi:DNA-binding beta-propeller fold protein YncE
MNNYIFNRIFPESILTFTFHFKKVRVKKLILLFCISFFVFTNMNAQTTSQYKIANKFSLEGDGGWDYLTSDDSTGRLFISHGTVTQCMDEATGKLLGTIPDTKGVHGIAIAHDLNKGFISCGKDTAVTIFDLTTLAIITKIKTTGQNPDAILYDPFTKRVFTWNGKSSNSTVVDATTNAVIGTIALEGKPEFSVTDGKGKIYVNIEDKSLLDEINPATMKVEKSWKIKPGQEASGLALDNENHRLFLVTDNKLMVIMNAETGKVITSLPIGDGVDGCAYDPGTKRAYASNGDGTMTVVQEDNSDKFHVVENVATQKGARTITVNKKTHHIYMPTAQRGEAPEATKDNPHPRAAVIPGTFVILDVVAD